MSSLTAVIIIVCIALTAGTLLHSSRMNAQDSLNLDCFRAGSAIYVGTFIIGNNWDYRLIFLIFLIPQLTLWSTGSELRARNAARFALLAIFISMWYLVIWKVLRKYSTVLDESSNWLLFSLLVYLLVLSAPDWVKESVQYPLRLTSRFWGRLGRR